MTGLTLRVINNVNKRMEVKPKFYDAFKGEGFPSEFSYTQKVPKPLATLCTLARQLGGGPATLCLRARFLLTSCNTLMHLRRPAAAISARKSCSVLST